MTDIPPISKLEDRLAALERRQDKDEVDKKADRFYKNAPLVVSGCSLLVAFAGLAISYFNYDNDRKLAIEIANNNKPAFHATFDTTQSSVVEITLINTGGTAVISGYIVTVESDDSKGTWIYDAGKNTTRIHGVREVKEDGESGQYGLIPASEDPVRLPIAIDRNYTLPIKLSYDKKKLPSVDTVHIMVRTVDGYAVTLSSDKK